MQSLVKSNASANVIPEYCPHALFQKTLIAIFLILFALISFGQIPNIQQPQPQQFQPINIGSSGSLNSNKVSPETQRANQQIQQYEQGQKRETQRKKEIEELYREMKSSDNKPIQYNFPSLASQKGTNFYQKAFDSILIMLQKKEPMSLKRAVFLTENAYYENQIKFSEFNQGIKTIAATCRQIIKDKEYSTENNTAKIMALFQFFADTTIIAIPNTNKKIKHNPFNYDFDDFNGKDEWSKMFVMKLLSKGSGQCHSMPMLFLVCCEELGAKAFLSYSPNHAFVRFIDDHNKLRNIELTNSRFTSDTWILASGFLKSEALKSKIYLDTLGVKKVVAQCLEDLAMGYTVKYGYDDFVLKVLDSALTYHPNNINAVLLKSNYYTYLFDNIATQKGRPSLEKILQDGKAKAVFDKRNELYDWEGNSGFTEMPSEAYQKWLSSVNDMQQIQQDKILKNEITKSINLMQQK